MKSIATSRRSAAGPATEPLAVHERDQLASQFKALAEPTRVAIVNQLSARREVCVCNLVEAFDLSQPTDLAPPEDPARGRPRRVDAARDVGVLPARARGARRAAGDARRMKARALRLHRQRRPSQMAQAFYERARRRGALAAHGRSALHGPSSTR
jgi:hypothetical protein